MSKTWKAIVVAMMLLAVVFTAVACGQKETTPPEPVVEQVTDKVIEGFGTFSGTLVDGKPSEGILVGSDFTYEGTFEDGYAITGTGKITYGDGVTAEGPILNRQLHGWGKVDYQNGCIGIGQWEKGVMNGIVYFCWRQPSGAYDVYYGNWTNGVREDDDAWYMFGNGCWYVGEFHDWINGQGEFHWTNGNMWKGEFVGGSPKKGTTGFGIWEGVEGWIAIGEDGGWSWGTEPTK